MELEMTKPKKKKKRYQKFHDLERKCDAHVL